MLRSRSTTIIALAVALAAPGAAAAQQDLRSPDARDAGGAAVVVQDLRSPDARDAATPIVPAEPAGPPVVGTDGFGWGDAGIGAAGMLGLVLGMSGLTVLVVRRRDGLGPLAH